MLVGFIRVDQLADDAKANRAEQIAHLHDATCSTDATLRRLIGTQRLNRPALRRLGFSDAQIAGAAEEVQKQKDKALELLGERDPTCPKE